LKAAFSHTNSASTPVNGTQNLPYCEVVCGYFVLLLLFV